MKGEQIVSNLDELLAFIQTLSGYDWKKPLIFKWLPFSKKRSLPMNSLSHVWYNLIAEKTQEAVIDVKCECKLLYGVPILRAEDEDFRLFYDKAIKKNLTYEEKLKAMRFIPVTSRMNDSQMARFLTHMQNDYAKNGIILESTGEYAEWQKQEAERHG